MQEDLATLIRNTAAQVRARDFMWAVGISAGVCAALIIAGLADWRMALLAWFAFMAALAVRYRFSSGRVWAAPVQRSTPCSRKETFRSARSTTKPRTAPFWKSWTMWRQDKVPAARRNSLRAQRLSGFPALGR